MVAYASTWEAEEAELSMFKDSLVYKARPILKGKQNQSAGEIA